MKRISLKEFSKYPNQWHQICPNLDISNPPTGYVAFSESKIQQLFGDSPPQMEDWKPDVSSPVQAPQAGIPQDKWPLWAKVLAKTAKPDDKGIGDVIERTIGPIGGDAYKKWFEKLTGKPCGCKERQETINSLYPLK